jgi:hypothetical protein
MGHPLNRGLTEIHLLSFDRDLRFWMIDIWFGHMWILLSSWWDKCLKISPLCPYTGFLVESSAGHPRFINCGWHNLHWGRSHQYLIPVRLQLKKWIGNWTAPAETYIFILPDIQTIGGWTLPTSVRRTPASTCAKYPHSHQRPSSHFSMSKVSTFYSIKRPHKGHSGPIIGEDKGWIVQLLTK